MNDFADEYTARERLVEKHFELASIFAARSGYSSAKDVCAIWVNHAAQIAFIAYLIEHDLRALCVCVPCLVPYMTWCHMFTAV